MEESNNHTSSTSSSSSTTNAKASSLISPIRIGTWNILSYNDEYDSEYGCPLSIAYTNYSCVGNCAAGGSSASATNGSTNNDDADDDDDNDDERTSIIRKEFTKRRYLRIWDTIENIFVTRYDILCLQEVSDMFLQLQSTTNNTNTSSSLSSSSNWKIVHRNMECALLLSVPASSYLHVRATYNLSNVPHLSGCGTSIPMMVVQQQYAVTSSSTSTITTNGSFLSTITPTITYLIGSVHVQASVSNMKQWFQTTIDTLIKHTYYDIITTITASSSYNRSSNTSNSSNSSSNINVNNNVNNNNTLDWIQSPVMIILGGDYNHNISSTSTTTTSIKHPLLPYPDWSLVTIPSSPETKKETKLYSQTDNSTTAASPQQQEWILSQLPGTTQKEYNYMGYYDGFLLSTKSILLYSPLSFSSASFPIKNDTSTMSNHMNGSNVAVFMKGFMPKVVYGFSDEIKQQRWNDTNHVDNNAQNQVAQFALITTRDTPTITVAATTENETQTGWRNNNCHHSLWNTTMLQDWMYHHHHHHHHHDDTNNNTTTAYNNNRNASNTSFQLLFSSISQFCFNETDPITETSNKGINNSNTCKNSNNNDNDENDVIVFGIVPYSNPFIQSLSDHLLVSASFHVIADIPTISSSSPIPSKSSNDTTNSIPTMTATRNKSEKQTKTLSMDKNFKEENISAIGWSSMIVIVVIAIGIGVVLRKATYRQSLLTLVRQSSSSSSTELDRLSTSCNTPNVQQVD